MNIGKAALIFIDENKMDLLPKKAGLKYHIQYVLERSKKDKSLRKLVNQFDVGMILETPSLIQETIIKALVENGYIVFCNMWPQNLEESYLFVGYGPHEISDLQRRNLEELKKQKIDIYEMGMLNSLGEFETVCDNPAKDLGGDVWIDAFLNCVSEVPSRK